MSSPGGSPTAGAGPGTAEVIFGQILQQMQAGMAQMSQESNRRFELLEAALQEQVNTQRVTAEAQVKAFDAMAKKSNVVDIKGVGKPDTLKGSHEDARKVWKTWSYKFESWFSSQFPAKGQECLDWARNKGDETIQESTLTEYVNKVPEAVDVDRQLHVALISLTSEMPYTVVFNARKRCGLDAWRRLCHVYEPHNARSNMRLLRRILVQPRSTLEQLRASIDKWEADLAEYVQRGNKDLDDAQKTTILLSMVPETLEDHLEMNIARLDTYAKTRAEVISYTEQKAAKVDDGGAAPMELDAFKGKGGKGSKGGRGGGNSGGGKGQGNPDKDIVCRLCQKKGHRKANCWHAKENGGTGKTPAPKEPKGGKQPKGKGKGKTGKPGKGKANAFEGEGPEGQEWPEDGEAEEPSVDGNLGFLCVLGPSADSAPDPPEPARGHICRAAFGPSSWAWSQPWSVTLAQCVVGKNKDGETIYWCPCPGCKGQKKRFNEAGLNAHLWSKLNEVGHANEAQWDAWDKEARQGYYVRPALREVKGPDAHCGHDPTWIYLPEEPDYSKHVPEGSDSEGGESENECAEDEAVEETTQETSEETWGDWGKGGKKDRFKGTPARVEPEGDLPGHRYSSGTSGSVSRSRSPAVKHQAEEDEEVSRHFADP